MSMRIGRERDLNWMGEMKIFGEPELRIAQVFRSLH
jgi:hypothetical protein